METLPLTYILIGAGVFVLWVAFCVSINFFSKTARLRRKKYRITLELNDEHRREQNRLRRLNNH